MRQDVMKADGLKQRQVQYGKLSVENIRYAMQMNAKAGPTFGSRFKVGIHIAMGLGLLGVALPFKSYTQTVSSRVELHDEVKKLREYKIPRRSVDPISVACFAFLRNGIAALSADSTTILCYDPQGRIVWQTPSGMTPSPYFQSSTDGNYLKISYRIDEDAVITAVFSAEGKLLWNDTLSNGSSISSSNKYLLVDAAVYDIVTGTKIDWANEHDYGDIAVSRNDKLAYSIGGKVGLFDLENKKRLWETSVEFQESAIILISDIGNTISYRGHSHSKGNECVIYLFNASGEVLWQNTAQMIPGQTNGGVPKIVSNDGELIALADLDRYSIFSTRVRRELVRLPRGYYPLFLFTKEALAYINQRSTFRMMTFENDAPVWKDYFVKKLADYHNVHPFYEFGSSDLGFVGFQETADYFIVTEFGFNLNELR